jgi:Uri superfamily endonuclease
LPSENNVNPLIKQKIKIQTLKENQPNFKSSSKKGTYILLIFVSRNVNITIGKLGKKLLSRGYYTYTGSALGKGATSLPVRLKRHLKHTKTKHWHIDYLLANIAAKIIKIIVIPQNVKLECKVNQSIRNNMKAEIPIPKFGSSDCTEICGSHLLFIQNTNEPETLIQNITEILTQSA